MRSIPQVKKKIDEQLSSTLNYIRKEKNTHLAGQDYVENLPTKGLSKVTFSCHYKYFPFYGDETCIFVKIILLWLIDVSLFCCHGIFVYYT